MVTGANEHMKVAVIGVGGVGGYFRFNRKHRIDFDYFEVTKQGAAVAEVEGAACCHVGDHRCRARGGGGGGARGGGAGGERDERVGARAGGGEAHAAELGTERRRRGAH